ncbi:MAG: tRNA (cytidine(34)-2'-O)-methyltransferase [Clostridia bacterium]|nr:tRNA (cytidine(34)-2'-O)-methyltransferase [Clostridia bacterium]
MNIVLVEPEIPQNTGNIARTCAATGSHLHLIRPLGFSLADKYLKRAGLDYWNLMRYTVYDSLDEFFAQNPGAACFYASTKAPRSYCDARYGPDDYLVFGRESRGLDEALLRREYDRCVRIPMRAEARSLNLSNSVAVVLYEALRQQGFAGLEKAGSLTRSNDGLAWTDYV